MRLIRGQEETGNLCEQDGLVVGRECELDFSRGAAGETAQDSVATVESTMLAVETIEVHQEICEVILSLMERAPAYKALYCITTGLESPNA